MKNKMVWVIVGIVLIAVVAYGITTKRPKNSTNTNSVQLSTTLTTMSSPSFIADGQIPKDFTCDGKNINPEIDIATLPPGARYLAVMMQDLDGPNGVYDHWVVWNIPFTTVIGEDFKDGTTGKNSAGKNEYAGPCPSSGEHRYRFQVYGYNAPLTLSANSTSAQLITALTGKALIRAELTGKYKK